MSDIEYAVCVYCQVFGVVADNGDAYTRGILDAIKTLSDREQTALESRFRFNRKFRQIGDELGVGTERARQIVNKAFLKLRHQSKLRNMSVARICEQYSTKLEDANATITELRNQIEKILQGDPVEHIPRINISEMDFSARAEKCLVRANITTVESLLALDTREELHRIRSLGVKSQENIISKMRERGFTEWSDRMEANAIVHVIGHEIDFSGRTANLLRGIRRNTEESLLSLETLDGLLSTPGFGVKTLDEIITKMRELGHAEWANRMESNQNSKIKQWAAAKAI